MASREQLKILYKGAKAWNKWRSENTKIRPRLRNAILSTMVLREVNFCKAILAGSNLFLSFLNGADLTKADLSQANLHGTDLSGANLSGSNLSGANLREANLKNANLSGANLSKADLTKAYLVGTDLSRADLIGVDLTGASLVETIIDGARISESSVYGVSVWGLKGEFAEQKELVITREGEPRITVENIKVAQFIYLILNNEEIRDVINTLTSKSVLILGRFALPERKAILDVLRNKLREYNLLPIVFDFERPTNKDYTETVQTLAGLSLFVIVDVTNPKSTPLEMEATVKQFKIPYVPIIDLSVDLHPFAMIVDSQKSLHWVLPTVGYNSKEELLENIDEAIISRALEKHNELRVQKAKEPEVLTIEDLKKGKKKKLERGTHEA